MNRELGHCSDPAVAAIEPISAVRIRRFVSECGLLRLGSRLCLADVDMALQWRTPHHLPTERERDDADAAATAAAAAPAGTAVAVAAVAAAERAGGGPGFHTSGSALTRRLPELSFNDFCYVTVSLACKAFVKLGARNALRKLLDLLSAMTATSNAATDAVGSNANGDDILVAEGDGSGGGVVQPQGPAVGATPTPAGGGGSASGASSAHWPAAWQSGRAAARPTSMDEVRPVIERERQTLARIFEAYALPRDRCERCRVAIIISIESERCFGCGSVCLGSQDGAAEDARLGARLWHLSEPRDPARLSAPLPAACMWVASSLLGFMISRPSLYD